LGSLTTLAAVIYFKRSSSKEEKEDRVNVAKTVSSHEDHVNLITDIISRLWPHINVAGCATVREVVEPMFKEMMPKALSNLHFTELDLGQVPIRLDNVVVHELKDGMLQFDLDVTWHSESNIKLSANYGLNFGVKSIKMNGRMIFTLRPLTNELPIVSAIQYGFVNTPELELDFTGLASIADFAVIEKTIRKIIQDILSSMMVLPNSMVYKMDPACDFREVYKPPKSIARITCVNGRGFVVQKSTLGKDDIPDVYCLVKLGSESQWRSSTIKDDLSPVWNESKDFLLSHTDQILTVDAWDEDKGALNDDDYLGTAELTICDMLMAGQTIEVELMQKVKGKNKKSGASLSLACDICNFTQKSISSLKNVKHSKDKICGLLTIVIAGALDLPVKKEDAASFVKITYEKHEFMTGVVVDAEGIDALNPVYDAGFHIPLTEALQSSSAVKLVLLNGKNSVLGETEVKLNELEKAFAFHVSETRQLERVGSGGPMLKFAVGLSGVEDSHTAGTTTDLLRSSLRKSSKGIDAEDEKVRISIISGVGFTIKKKRLKKNDIPDIYCMVKFGTSPKEWRTPTIKDSIEPSWNNESNEYSLQNLNQVISLEVMDENKRGKDDHVGSARTTVGNVLLRGGEMEMRLQKNGRDTGAFIQIGCIKL